MKSIIIALLISIAAFSARASGTRVGDGGHGVACDGWGIELLDLYEARVTQGRSQPWIIGEEKSELDYIFELRLAMEYVVGEHDPSMRIFDDATMLWSLKRIEAGPLPSTLDQGMVDGLRTDCHIEQIAIRGTGVMNGSLVIRQDYWMQASARERALLLIHEAAHGWFEFDDAKIFTGDSALRQFVGLVSTAGMYVKEGDVIREILQTRAPVARERLSEAALR